MQAPLRSNRFDLGSFGIAIVALGFLVGVAIGVMGPIAFHSLPTRGDNRSVVAPKAFTEPGHGEGLLNGNDAVTAAPVSHGNVGMGEGIVGGIPHTITSMPIAHVSPGQGEGWVVLGRPTPTKMHASGHEQ